MSINNYVFHKRTISLSILIIFFYYALNFYLIRYRWAPIADNYYYAFPYFNYMLQSLATFNALPLWNSVLNQGEPTFLLINHAFLLHIPYIPFYLLAGIWENFDPYIIFWLAVFFSSVLQAFGIAFLVLLITNSEKIFVYGLFLSLFGGLSVGEYNQSQINASILYIPWCLSFLILTYRSRSKLNYYLFCGTFGFSLINHYPHLVIYFWLVLGASWFCFNSEKLNKIKSTILDIGLINITNGICLIILLAMPTILIYYEYSELLISPFRGLANNNLHSNYFQIEERAVANSLNPNTLLHFFFPQGMTAKYDTAQGPSNSIIFYIGIVPIFFYLFALFQNNKKLNYINLSILLILTLGFGGHSFGYFMLYQFIPFSHLQRIPLHLADYISFLLIIGSSVGLHTIKSYFATGNSVILKYKETAILLVLIFILTFLFINHINVFTDSNLLKIWIDDLVIFILLIVVFKWLIIFKKAKGFWLVLSLFLVFDLGRFYFLNLNTQKQSRYSRYENLPILEKYFEWHHDFKSIYETGTGRLYMSLLLGVPSIDPKRGELVTFTDYDKFRLTYDKFRQNSNFSYPRICLVDLIIPTNLILSELFKNDINSVSCNPKEYDIIVNSPNKVELKVLNPGPNKRLLYIDHADKGWEVYINGTGRRIENVGPFKSVILDSKINQTIIWSYKPFWRYFVYIDYIFACLLILIFSIYLFQVSIFSFIGKKTNKI